MNYECLPRHTRMARLFLQPYRGAVWQYAGGVLRALTGGCYRGAGAPLGLPVAHIHRSPEGISAQDVSPPSRGDALRATEVRDRYRAPVVGDAPRHQPRVNPRRTRSARTAIPLRGMVAKAMKLSAEPFAIRPRSAALHRMVRSGFCYTDFCWRDGGILTPVRPLHTVFHTTYLLT